VPHSWKATIVLVGLLALLLLGYWRLRRTNIYKARRRHGFDPGFQGTVPNATRWKKNEPTLPPAAYQGLPERPPRRWWFARKGD
jgi:hypothetical protein